MSVLQKYKNKTFMLSSYAISAGHILKGCNYITTDNCHAFLSLYYLKYPRYNKPRCLSTDELINRML